MLRTSGTQFGVNKMSTIRDRKLFALLGLVKTSSTSLRVLGGTIQNTVFRVEFSLCLHSQVFRSEIGGGANYLIAFCYYGVFVFGLIFRLFVEHVDILAQKPTCVLKRFASG